jgi:hypothetical protein
MLVLAAGPRIETPNQCTFISHNEHIQTRSYFKEIRVEWLFNFNLKAKLFLNLAGQALRGRFTKFDLAARKFPLVSIVLKQDDSPIRRGQDTFDGYFEHGSLPSVREGGKSRQAGSALLAGQVALDSMPAPGKCREETFSLPVKASIGDQKR